MRNQFHEFLKLHQQAEPLLIGNVWNAQSAKVFEGLGFKAIATSSSAVAATLGYADGEQMTFEEYLFVIKRIVASVSVPVSVDLETGYGKNASEIFKNIKQLHAIGICGINIEDSTIAGGKRSLVDAVAMAGLVTDVVKELTWENISVFINLRSDPFLLNVPDSLAEAKRRIELYNETGAHGLFLPFVNKQEDISEVVKATSLPVNVLAMPNLPDFNSMKNAGVKRISMGGWLNARIYESLKVRTEEIVKAGSFASLF